MARSKVAWRAIGLMVRHQLKWLMLVALSSAIWSGNVWACSEQFIELTGRGTKAYEDSNYTEAESLVRAALELYEDSQDSMAVWCTGIALISLGRLSAAQQRFGDAERHLLRALEIHDVLSVSEDPLVTEIRQNEPEMIQDATIGILQFLASMYEHQGRQSDANKMKARIELIFSQ
jgi:hypothetical protein